MGLSCGIVRVILRLAVLIQYRSVTDTHTQTHDDGIYRAKHSCRAVMSKRRLYTSQTKRFFHAGSGTARPRGTLGLWYSAMCRPFHTKSGAVYSTVPYRVKEPSEVSGRRTEYRSSVLPSLVGARLVSGSILWR